MESAALSTPDSGPDKPGGAGTNAAEARPDTTLETLAHKAMTRARAALVLEHPFFGTLALRLRFKPDAACRDLWTDGRTLAYNPAYAATLPEKRLIGAQAHEVMHLALGHHVRRKGRDPDLWNRACDLAVNQMLLDAGFSLPEGFAHDPDYAGKAADDIFTILLRLREDRESNNGAKGAFEQVPGEARGEAGGASPVAGEGEGEESAKRPEEGPEEENDASGSAVPGGKERAKAEPDAVGAPAKAPPGFTGEVRDHPDIDGRESEQERRLAEQEADIALAQAMQRALNMGSLPAGFARLTGRPSRPGLDWKELLSRFLERCADNDYSWTMPNRRYLHQDIYLPSRHEARLSRVALAVDSSGSVDERALAAFCAELSALLESYDATLTVLFHDTRVQGAHTLTRHDLPLRLTPLGGGGTDYRPVCAYIDDNRVDPLCLIWFTDLQCSRFPETPAYPVLWMCSLPVFEQPPFGEAVAMNFLE